MDSAQCLNILLAGVDRFSEPKSLCFTQYSALALFHRTKPKHLIKFIIQSIAFQMTTTTIRI